MPQVTFYPLGNADSYLIALAKKKILFDFAAMRDPNAGEDDRRIDLPDAIKTDIGWPTYKEFDVVAFSHIDDDHVKGSADFFYLDHADCYKGDDRVKIKQLWVPAAAIVEEGTDGDARVIRQEARHRLRNGSGILVFSRPEHLKDWFEQEGIPLESRKHLIVDAGKLVPGLTLEADGVEFFVHAPFAERDGTALLDRNDNSLVFQATFSGGTQMLCTDDITHGVWEKIVDITEAHQRSEKLHWDLMKGSHHCSYLVMSEEKGKTETDPTPQVERLLGYAKQGAKVVLTCDPIDDVDQKQPPHFQTRNRYKRTVTERAGELFITMEYPDRNSPGRLTFDITPAGFRLVTLSAIAAANIYTRPSPRMG